MEFITGEILTEDGFVKAYITLDKNRFLEIGRGRPNKKPICKGLIVPTLVNSHTHIGDSFIKDKGIDLPKDIEELVAPPDGLKHRLLKEASDEVIIRGMQRAIDVMINSGTEFFLDFRENGISGVNKLKSATHQRPINPIVLSRPNNLKFNKNEIDLLLDKSDGIAISSISDWDYSELQKIAGSVNQKGKLFALHASERIHENIDNILDLKPGFLVHMIKASESDFIRVKQEKIPVVVCPRSNSFFGLRPDFKLMKKVDINVLLGTDNAMLNSPNLLEEICFIRSISNSYSKHELLFMSTFGARKALNLKGDILGSDSMGNFVVLDDKSLRPLYISFNSLEDQI
jgi:cytosine/adenosine deaminase-related metal-dependent hydrolase